MALKRLDATHRFGFIQKNGASVGIILFHEKVKGEYCRNVYLFKEGFHLIAGAEPSIAPAITCSCGDKGWILDGKWERYVRPRQAIASK